MTILILVLKWVPLGGLVEIYADRNFSRNFGWSDQMSVGLRHKNIIFLDLRKLDLNFSKKMVMLVLKSRWDFIVVGE